MYSSGPGLSMEPTILQGHVNGLPLQTIPNKAGPKISNYGFSASNEKDTIIETKRKTILIWEGFCLMRQLSVRTNHSYPKLTSENRWVTEIL